MPLYALTRRHEGQRWEALSEQLADDVINGRAAVLLIESRDDEGKPWPPGERPQSN